MSPPRALRDLTFTQCLVTEAANCFEAADARNARACPQKTAGIDSLRFSSGEPHYGSGPVHTSLYVRVTWDLWLGHLPRSLERARAETGGADQRVLKWREFQVFVRMINVNSASLGCPLSVFNETLLQPDFFRKRGVFNESWFSKFAKLDCLACTLWCWQGCKGQRESWAKWEYLIDVAVITPQENTEFNC